MASAHRCGTCVLLDRSGTSGLETFGKCPHRYGWVRTHDDGCEHHASERRNTLVLVMMLANVAAALAGFGTYVYYDARRGNLASHLVLAGVALVLLVFAWLVFRLDLLSEEPKFELLERSDPPPKDDDAWWRRDD